MEAATRKRKGRRVRSAEKGARPAKPHKRSGDMDWLTIYYSDEEEWAERFRQTYHFWNSLNADRLDEKFPLPNVPQHR